MKISVALSLILLASSAFAQEPLHVFASNGVKAVAEDLKKAAEKSVGRPIELTFDSTAGLRKKIAAGEKVTLWWSSANRDEAEFPDPFTFDVARSPNRHLAFGHGAHFCLGAGLARLEVRLILDAVLDRIAAIEPTGPVEWVRSNKHTGVRHAPVALRPH